MRLPRQEAFYGDVSDEKVDSLLGHIDQAMWAADTSGIWDPLASWLDGFDTDRMGTDMVCALLMYTLPIDDEYRAIMAKRAAATIRRREGNRASEILRGLRVGKQGD